MEAARVSDAMLCNVCRVEYTGEPNHVGIFVETKANGGGMLFHVVGDIFCGMAFQAREARSPEESPRFAAMQHVGRILRADLSGLDAACRAVPPPGPQMSTYGVRFDTSKPVRRCGDWTAEVMGSAKYKEVVKPLPDDV